MWAQGPDAIPSMTSINPAHILGVSEPSSLIWSCLCKIQKQRIMGAEGWCVKQRLRGEQLTKAAADTWSWGAARLSGAGKACSGTPLDLPDRRRAAWLHSSFTAKKTNKKKQVAAHTNLSPGWWSWRRYWQPPACVSKPWSYWRTRNRSFREERDEASACAWSYLELL